MNPRYNEAGTQPIKGTAEGTKHEAPETGTSQDVEGKRNKQRVTRGASTGAHYRSQAFSPRTSRQGMNCLASPPVVCFQN